MKVINFANKKMGLDGETDDIVMGLDADNHRNLLNSLTYLYANPVMAAFREYCANASDAHKDSDQKKPFEVSFPHRFESQSCLRIRDYGKGMTEEQITKVYSQYGATTKANNNAQVGGFGLGSKSGLAVSNNLHVNTIANGILIKAKILKNKDNESVIRIISRTPTKEASGTEIILPLTVPQLNELRAKAVEELVGYHPSQVKLNGDQLTYSVHNVEQFLPVNVGSNVVAYVAFNDTLRQNRYGLSDYAPDLFKADLSIIMGGVYYPSMPTMGSVDVTDRALIALAADLNNLLKNSPKVILNVPVGSVDLPPHRDSIIDTAKTWDSLRGLLMNLRMGIPAVTERHLNALSLKEAARTVGSMQSLFAPTQMWKHKGKNYSNDMGATLSNVPFLYTRLSHYYSGGIVRLDGRVAAEHFTALQTRNNASEYNYQNNTKKKKIVVANLTVESDKYDELFAYEENERKHYSVKKKMNKPRIHGFINRYLKDVLEDKFDTEDFYLVVTAPGTRIPSHFTGIIDFNANEEEVRAEYRKLFPPEPKKIVEQKHCRLTADKMEYSLVSSSDKIVYFGGKDAYGTEDFMQSEIKGFVLPQVAMMKKISRGSVYDTKEYNWVQVGLLNLIPSGAALIAVGDTRAPKLFKKAFNDAQPLGEIVMSFYDSLDEDRKEAVQHAYSIFSMWGDGTDRLFNLLGGTGYSMQNKSIQLLFSEPELVSVGHYLFAFKDNYVEGLKEWKKDVFLPSLKGKELAWMMLLPLQSLLGQVNYHSAMLIQDGRVNTTVAVRTDSSLHLDDLAEFINKLTAN